MVDSGTHTSLRVDMYHGDCSNILPILPAQSIHAVIADPPFIGIDFSVKAIQDLREGTRGLWRQPRAKRAASPRFTDVPDAHKVAFATFMQAVAKQAFTLCLPGAHAFIATTPLWQHLIAQAFIDAGWEMRTTIIRCVQTLRGGDRPKNAHEEFPMCTVLPRSAYEPWPVFRKPLENTVAHNLRKYGTGALRRVSQTQPFCDVIASSRTPRKEKRFGHPTQKPTAYISHLVKSCLPGDGGTVLDMFMGSGTTAIAAIRNGRSVICIEKDATFFAAGVERVKAEIAASGVLVNLVIHD